MGVEVEPVCGRVSHAYGGDEILHEDGLPVEAHGDVVEGDDGNVEGPRFQLVEGAAPGADRVRLAFERQQLPYAEIDVRGGGPQPREQRRYDARRHAVRGAHDEAAAGARRIERRDAGQNSARTRQAPGDGL